MNMERPFTINMKSQQYSKYIRPLIEAGVAGYTIERIWNLNRKQNIHTSSGLVQYLLVEWLKQRKGSWWKWFLSQPNLKKKITGFQVSILQIFKK